jgi:hypothetical protein
MLAASIAYRAPCERAPGKLLLRFGYPHSLEYSFVSRCLAIQAPAEKCSGISGQSGVECAFVFEIASH